MSTVRVCVLGLGGGGFAWEAQKIVSSVRRPLELVLVFSGPRGGLKYFFSDHQVVGSYDIRSPALTGDRTLGQVRVLGENVLAAFKIIRKERPDVVLAVGTAQAIPWALAARVLHCPIWYAESVTRVRTPSRTARIMQSLATRNYFFWRELPLTGMCMEDA